MVVLIAKVTGACDTSNQGRILHTCLLDALQAKQIITLDFQGISGVTSSFVNTAFIPLLDHMSFDQIKARLRILNANRQIANMIRDRMSIQSQRIDTAA